MVRRLSALGSLVALASVAALFAGISPARAAGDGVSFLRRDYDLQIQHNGDVAVAEHWQVRFSGSSYTSATLGVLLTHTQSVDFKPVEGADPQSERVARVTDGEGHAIEQISWTFPAAQDATRAFTIPYTLHAAIGRNTTQAWLDRHFFDGPGRGSFPVSATHVTVTLPDAAGADVQVKAVYPGAQPQISHPSDTMIAVDSQNMNSGQLLEVEVVFPRAQLDANVARPAWQQGDTPPTPPTALDRVASGEPGSSTSATNPVGAFLSNTGLVLAVGLAIVAILGLLAWRLSARLAADLRKLAGLRAEADEGEDGDDGALPAITQKLPAIDLDFGEVEWPRQDEELDLEALGLRPLETGKDGPISRVGETWDEQDLAEDSPNAGRGPGATSGVGHDGD
jgi:hypothetical protein